MATPASFSEEECFNVYWKIKNFSYCYDSIKSPQFNFSGQRSRLELSPSNIDVVCDVSYSDHRYVPKYPVQISFLTCDGSSEKSATGDKFAPLTVLKDVIFGNRRDAFLPDDTLTVRFRCLTESERGRIFICSRIGVKRNYFLWTYKYNSNHSRYYVEDSELYGRIELVIKSTSAVNSDEQFSIDIFRTGGERCYCVLKISVLDVDGNALNEVSDEFVFTKQGGTQIRGFPSVLKKSKFIGYKNLLLSEDSLSLKCYFAVSSGTVTDDAAVISRCDNATALVKVSESLLRDFTGKNDSRRDAELETDLKSILENGTLHDVSLRIGEEVVRAHKSILGARSAVFRAMFTKDMREANSNAVVIEDFDLDTVRRLLLYMYTDSVHHDQWEEGKKLFCAADKYQVLSLKAKCASFLKTNLSVSYVCEALILAELHQDADLRTAAIDFISEFDSAVFASEDWKELEQNNSSLVFQVLRKICCNKKN